MNDTEITHEPLWTEKEMATYLNVHPRTLVDWREKRLLPYVRIGRAIRYRKAEVDLALERMTVMKKTNEKN